MKEHFQGKEGKRLIILLVLMGAVAVAMAFRFAGAPFLDSWGAAAARAEELQLKLDAVDVMFSREGMVRNGLEDASAMLQEVTREHIPRPEDALSWATRTIYGHARDVGIEMHWIKEEPVGTGSSSLWKSSRAFAPYKVRVAATGSYEQFLQFLAAIEKNNPYACISGVTVTGQPQNVEIHKITLIVEWPMWVDPELPARILGETDDGGGERDQPESK